MKFIGIDIGTSSICGVVYDSSSKETISITKPNNSNLTTSQTWEKEQDPTIIITTVIKLIEELRTQHPDIAGIGISGQMHGVLYINSKGCAISPLYIWQDGRGEQLYKNKESYATFLSKQTGYPLSTGFGLVTHFYNIKNKLVPDNAYKICTIMDYVGMTLTKIKEPITDVSNAAGLGIFDKYNLQFDEQALLKAGIDKDILPLLSKDNTPLGYYKGIPIYPAIGDNQAAFLGSVQDLNHSIHITVGTSSQLSVYTNEYIEIPALDTRPLPGGGYLLVGAALCGGCSFALLKNLVAETIVRCTGQKITDEKLYRIMLLAASEINNEENLQIETLFNGTRLNPNQRGRITNISLSNFTLGHLVKGFLNGICKELYNFYLQIPDNIKNNKKIWVGSGNAIRQNKLLCQIFEQQCGCKLQLSPNKEEAALGASLYCAQIMNCKEINRY